MLGKILVEIFLTTGCIAELPENGRSHFEDNVSKNVPNMFQKSCNKSTKNGENRGLEGVLGGLGAFLEPCRAGLAAEVEKCSPEVTKNA